MGLINKALAKMNNQTLVRATPEELCSIVNSKFIEGADRKYLEDLKTTVKAGLLGGSRELKSHSGSQELKVIGSYFWTTNFFGRDVILTDDDTKTFYELPFSKYKKFRKAVLAELSKKGI